MAYQMTPSERRARALALKQQRENRNLYQQYLTQKEEYDRRVEQERLNALYEENKVKNQNFFVRAGHTIGDIAANVITGAVKGLEGIYDLGAGIVGAVGGIFDKGFQDDVKKHISYDWTMETFGNDWQEALKYSYTKNGGIVESVASGIGQMLPSVAVTIATGGAGAPAAVSQMASLATLGASAAGNATEEAFNDGAGYYAGLGYGLASGAVEIATEKMFGGATKGLFGKGMLDEVGKSIADTGIKRIAKNALEEGVEEIVSELANPLLRSMYKGGEALQDYGTGEYWAGVAKAGIVGSLTSLAYTGTVGYGLSKAGVGYVGKEADINESLAEIETQKKKAENLFANEKLTEQNESRISSNIVGNYQNIERTLKKASESKRASLIKKFSLEKAFNPDGSIKGDFATQIGLMSNEAQVAQEGQQGSNEGLASQFKKEYYSPSLRGSEAMIQADLAAMTERLRTDEKNFATQQGREAQEIAEVKPFTGEMSDTAKKNYTSLKKGLNALNNTSGGKIRLVVVDSHDSINGSIVNDSTFYISESQLESGAWAETLVHEYTHFAEGSKEYGKLLGFLQSDDILVEGVEGKSIPLWQKAQEAVIRNYGFDQKRLESIVERVGKNETLSPEDMVYYNAYLSELGAHESEYLLGNEAFIDKIISKDKSLAAKIIEKIRNLKSMFEKTKDTRTKQEQKLIHKAEKLWLNAVEKAGLKYAGGKIYRRREVDAKAQNEYNGEASEARLSRKDSLINHTFPTYKESAGSEANTLATRWAHRADIEVGDRTAISYHDKWYLVEKFENSDLGYQIVAQISEKQYQEFIEERNNGIGKGQSIQKSVSVITSIDRRRDSSVGRVVSNDSVSPRNGRGDNQVQRVGEEQSQRGKTQSNRNGNSEGGGQGKRGIKFSLKEGEVSESALQELNKSYQEAYNEEREAQKHLDSFTEFEERKKRFTDILSDKNSTDEQVSLAIDEYAKWESESGYGEAYKAHNEAARRMREKRMQISQMERSLTERLYEHTYTSEEVRGYVSKAVKKFHTTTRLNKASYLLTTGSMLDFSDGQGYRVQDHREISDILNLPDYAEYSTGMILFMNMGNIRLQTYGIDIAAMPTERQFTALRGIISEIMRNEDAFCVDFSTKKGNTDGSVEYPKGTSSSRIISDIRKYFETGTLPEVPDDSLSKFRFSRKTTGRDTEGKRLTDEQIKFFEDSKVRDDEGNLRVVYHGTMSGEFTVFDASKANVESDMGAGFYFSDSYDDVGSNYENGGQDLEAKIDRLAERIEGEEDIDYDEAKQKARERLSVGTKLFEVYLDMKNPAYVGGNFDSPTMLFEDFFDYSDIVEDDFDSNDDYWEARDERVGETIQDLVDEVDRILSAEGITGYEGWEQVLAPIGAFDGGVTINDLKAALNESTELWDCYDSNGNMATTELLRAIIEALGYDGIIDNSVVDKWGYNSGRMEYMEGIDEETRHYIVFKPEQIKLTTNEKPTSNKDIRFSRKLTKDSDSVHGIKLSTLNQAERAGEVTKVYRAMQVIDGKLYSPMAAYETEAGKRTHKRVADSELGFWEESVESPSGIKWKNGEAYYSLDKGVDSTVDARYNPYIHSSNLPLNDQFATAYKRPNLVVVEGIIPNSELSSGYKAQYAKDSVGEVDWKSGKAGAALGRRVYLSRWIKNIRILSDSECADIISPRLKENNITIKENTVTPTLLEELKKRGVKIDYNVDHTTTKKIKLSRKDSKGRTLTEAQERFFRDSQVRDDKGNLLEVYHGTRDDFTIFDTSKGGQSNDIAQIGFWFTTSEKGAKAFSDSVWYGNNKESKAVECYLNITNPKVYESSEADSSLIEELNSNISELNNEMSAIRKKFGIENIGYLQSLNFDSLIRKLSQNKNLTYEEFDANIDRDTFAEWLKNARKILELKNQVKALEEKVYEEIYSDGYEKFRTDIYRMAGKTAEDANIGGVGRAIVDEWGKFTSKATIVEAFKDSLIEQGYDGIVIKNTNYDYETMGKGNTQYIAFHPNQIKLITNENPTSSVDIRFSKKRTPVEETHRTYYKLSDGQIKKLLANNTHYKVYSKVDAERIINNVLSQYMSFGEKYGEISGKSKAEVIDLLWKGLNSAEPGKQMGVALHIADYIIQNSVLESIYSDDDIQIQSAIDIVDALRPYLHSINLDSLKGEIKYRYDKDNSAYLLWGKRKGDKGIGVDTIPQILEEQGIYIDATSEADIFFEIDTQYRNAVKSLKKKAKDMLFESLSKEQVKELRQEIAREVLRGFDYTGKSSKLAEVLDKYKKQISTLYEKLRDSNRHNRATNRLLDKVQKIKNWKTGAFVNSSKFRSKLFKGSIERLAMIKNRGNLNQGGTRRILAGLAEWYAKDNPILGYVDGENVGVYNQEIADILQAISQNQKALTDEQVDLISVLQEKSGISDYKGLLEWYTKANLGKGYNAEVKSLLRELASETTFTTEEIIALEKVVGYFGNLIENYNKVIRNGKYVDAKPIAKGYIETIKRNKGVKVGWFSKFFDKVFNNGKASYLQTFADPMTVARYMDKYENGFYSEMLAELRAGGIKASVLEMNIRQPLEEFLSKHKKYGRGVSQRTIKYRGAELPALDAFLLYMTMNREQALGGLAEAGFTFNNGKETIRVDGFAKGEELTLPELRERAKSEQDELYKQFTEEDREYISIAEKIFNEDCKEAKRETDILRQGYSNVFEVYYVPIRRANSAVTVDSGSFFDEMNRVSNASFNKDTVQGAKGELFIEGLDEVLDRHIHGVSQYAGLATVIDQYDILYNLNMSEDANKPITVRTEGENTWAKGNDYFKKLISDLQGISPTRGGGSKLFGFFRGHYATYQLGLNPKVWFTQLSSFFASGSILDYSSILKGLSINAKDVDEYCQLAAVRNNDNSAAMAQGVMEKVDKVGSALMKPIGMVDRFVIKKLFGACQVQVEKDSGLKVGTEENKKKAGELLEKVIIETQQNSMATERSAAMRSGSELMKTLTMFTADSMKVFGRVVDSLGEVSVLKAKIKETTDSKAKAALEEKLKAAKKKSVKSVAALATTAIFMALIAQAFRWLYNKDDDDENIPANMAVDAIGNLMGGLPLIKDLYAKLTEGYDLNNYSYSALNDLFDAFSGTISTVTSLAKGEDIKPLRTVKELSFAVGQILGLPTRNVYNIIYGLMKRISPSTAYEWDNNLYNKNYSTDLQKAISNDDDEMLATIVGLMLDEKVGGIDNSFAREEMDRLVKGGYQVIPKSIGRTITYEGEEVEITSKQRERFKKVYGEANKALASLVNNKSYASASDEVKAKAVRFIYDIYYNLAIEDLLGVELETKNILFAKAIDISSLAIIVATARNIEADTDKKGNIISGSRKKKVQTYINSLGLKAAQKYMIMGYLGYSNKNGQQQVKSYIQRLSLTKSEKEKLYEYSGYAA